jgi:hypothetical protein
LARASLILPEHGRAQSQESQNAVSEGSGELLFHTRTSEGQLRVSVCQWRIAISTESRADARYVVGRPLWRTPVRIVKPQWSDVEDDVFAPMNSSDIVAAGKNNPRR